MEPSNQQGDQSRLIAHLISQNQSLKRKLDAFENNTGTERVEASSSRTQKKIRRESFPDLSGGFSQYNVPAAPFSSKNERAMEVQRQNEPEVLRLFKNFPLCPGDMDRTLHGLVNSLPADSRPKVPNLNLKWDDYECRGIWEESAVKHFESMARNSLNKLHGPRVLERTFQKIVCDMEEDTGTTIIDRCFTDDWDYWDDSDDSDDLDEIFQTKSTDTKRTTEMAKTLLQISLYLICTDSFSIIWQLYHGDPVKLRQKTLECYTKRPFETFKKEAKESVILSRVSWAQWVIPAEQHAAQTLLDEVITKIQGNTDEDKVLTFCLLLVRHYSPYDSEPIAYPFPTRTGFNAVLYDEITKAQSQIRKVIQNFIEARIGLSRKTHKSSQLLDQIEGSDLYDRKNFLIYSVPGSGKTRLMESLLSKRWGIFFMASNLQPHKSYRSVDWNSRNIYAAHREGYPKDLYYLRKLIQFYHKTFSGKPLYSRFLVYWLNLLFYSRILILKIFIEEIKNCQKCPRSEINRFVSVGPDLWLQFQKENDPFSALFWLLVVQSPSFDGIDSQPFSLRLLSENLSITIPSLIVCLDEAQMDLDTIIGSKFLGQDSPSFFQYFVSEGHMVLRGGATSSFVISGTSLRLKEIQAEIKKGFWSQTLDFQPWTDFPLLTTDDQFEQLLSEKDISLDDVNDAELKTVIIEHSRRFRGRYLWSVLYIDSLKFHNMDWRSHRELDTAPPEQVIAEVANRVMIRAKKDLKDHLAKIQDQDLVRHLCWIVICCEILDRKKVIAEDRDNRLIEEGFATVCRESKDGRPKGSLEEYLAMETALEWFRDERAELVETTMNRLLKYYAVDDSAFGKASEWFLAWELWSILREDDVDQIIGSTKNQRRNSILAILDKAVSVDERAQSARENKKVKNISSLHFGNYRLVRGKRIGSSYDGRSCGDNENTANVQRGEYDLRQYLQDIRTKSADAPPRTSIYFPENVAGPDLIFALEPAETTNRLEERILCVIQLKTGADFDIHDAIRTTDVCTSYLGETATKTLKEQDVYLKKYGLWGKRQELIHELEHWHKEGRRVIRILIAPEKSSIQKKTKTQILESKKHLMAQNLNLALNDFFILVSKQDAEKIFGNTFCAMLTELKAKEGGKVVHATRTRASIAPAINDDE